MDQYHLSQEKSFVTKYKTFHLVHIEFYSTINEAVTREKQIKKWKRDWKIELIEKNNKEWRNLVSDLANYL